MKTLYKLFFLLLAIYLTFHLGSWYGRTTERIEQEIRTHKAEVAHYKLLKAIMFYESSYRPHVYGDGGKAYGLFQFHERTFNQFKKQYGLNHFDRMNPSHQLILADLMIRDGHWKHWRATYHKAKRLAERWV